VSQLARDIIPFWQVTSLGEDCPAVIAAILSIVTKLKFQHADILGK